MTVPGPGSSPDNPMDVAMRLRAEGGGEREKPGMTRNNPLIRPSARVVLFGPDNRVLLFRVVEPEKPGATPFWITPGGGLEGDETFEECARREVLEETGISELELGPCVWVREHTWPWGRLWIRSVERYFVGRTSRSAVQDHLRLEHEMQFLAEHRWWSIDEMRAAREILVPRAFAALAEPLARGELPSEPIAAGE